MNVSAWFRRGSAVAAAVTLAGAASGGCEKKAGENAAAQTGRPTSRTATANNAFGFQLFSELTRQGIAKNIVISPTSLTYALTMAYNGAGGQTREDMARALGFQDKSLEEVNRSMSRQRTSLMNHSREVKLVIANALWANQSVRLTPDFVERNRRFLGAEARTLNFDDASALDTINRWVSRKTSDRIPAILYPGEVDGNTFVVLTNAVYDEVYAPPLAAWEPVIGESRGLPFG